MDSRTEKQKMKEIQKMNKKTLKQRCQDLMIEHEAELENYRQVQEAYNGLVKSYVKAIQAEDEATAAVVKSKMDVLEKELERLSKREKTLAEEIDLIERAQKNNFDGKSGAWMTAGAWIVGIMTTGLSAWGLVKSHKSFEDGSMVDKGTRGIAERLNGLFSFMNFRK